MESSLVDEIEQSLVPHSSSRHGRRNPKCVVCENSIQGHATMPRLYAIDVVK